MGTSGPATGASAGSSYPGERLGLPAAGQGAVAGWGRRLLALGVDWAACLLVVGAFVGTQVWTGTGLAAWAPLLVFLVEASLLTALVGGSFGQLVCRVVVVRLGGAAGAGRGAGPVSLLQSTLRTFLICLVIPPLVFNPDQRGLHDLAVGTITLRR